MGLGVLHTEDADHLFAGQNGHAQIGLTLAGNNDRAQVDLLPAYRGKTLARMFYFYRCEPNYEVIDT